MMDRKLVMEMLDWVLINFAIPLILPLLFALCVKLFYVKVDMSIFELFSLLLKNGVYTFLGLTILISLFHDYREVPEAFSLSLYIGMFFSLFIIGFIFISSLGFVPEDSAISYEENINAFIIATIGTLSLSLLFKYRILKSKYQKDII